MPHGNTQIVVNDLLTFVAEPEVESVLRAMCVNSVKAVQEPERLPFEEPLLPEIEEEIEELEDMLAAEYDDTDDPAPDEIDEAVD